MLSIADIPLCLVDWEAEERINYWLSLDKIRPFLSRSWPGPGSTFVGWPTGYRPWPPTLRCNRLCWPQGASRWAYGCFIVDNDYGYASMLHDAAFGRDGTSVKAVSLVMDSPDETTGAVEESLRIKQMYVMAILPLKRCLRTNNPEDGVFNSLYLVVVADQRIFWWDVPTPDLGISEGAGVTWRQAIDSCQAALGLSIQTSTIPSEYLAPSRALNLTNEPIPPVLDAIAANIGMRLVVSYDGIVTMTNFEDALNAYAKDWDAYPSRVAKVYSGGNRFLDTL